MVAPVNGLRDLTKIQIGLETTPGSDKAATARLIGKMTMAPDFKYSRPDDFDTGNLSSYERSDIIAEQAKISFEGDATYEQLPYILGMSIKGAVTGAGGGSPYSWVYEPSLTSANAPDTYTIEYGDNHQAYQSTFCFAKSLEISGQIDDAVKVKADMVGQSMATATFTTALSNPTSLSIIKTQTGKLYIDTTWAGLGGTHEENTLVDFNWKLTEGVVPIKKLDGSLSYADRVEKKRHIEFELTVGHNSVYDTLWTALLAQSKVFVRLEFTGPAITGGTDKLTMQGCFILDNPDTLGDQEGQSAVKIKLLSIYDPTSTKEWSVTLINALATMP